MQVGGQVTLLANDKMYKERLDLDDNNDLVFTVCSRGGQVVLKQGVLDLPYSWQQ